MCEFCAEHGEGKKWYLQMKNYAKELLQEELSQYKKGIVGADTRFDWNSRFIERFVMPAIPAIPRKQAAKDDIQPPSESPETTLREDEIIEHRKVEHFGQVIPIEDVEQVIDLADSISRMPCGCRFITTGKSDKRYCFGIGIDRLGILGKFPDAASSFEVLSKEEAKKIFRRYDQEGLMHSIWTGVTPYVLGICNCDRDCVAYKSYIEMRGAPYFFRAEYICQTDWEVCTGCKSCISQCQFGAQFYSSSLSKVYIDPTRCFGCGVCRAQCQKNAIRLIPRSESSQVAHVWLKEEI